MLATGTSRCSCCRLFHNCIDNKGSKGIINKLAVSSTAEVFLIEQHYEHAALQEELLIAPFVKIFKTTNLGKLYLWFCQNLKQFA